MQSFVFYDTLTPLQEYVLYYTIEEWIDLARDIDIDLHKPAPEYLKGLIKAEDQEPESVLSIIEDLGVYADVFLEDMDFDSESLRGLVQAAIYNTERFLCEMSFEDLDQYIDVMPVDVAEEYQAFRKKVTESKVSEKAIKMENSGQTTINVYGSISDSQIQVGTINSTQSINNNDTFPYEEIFKVVTEIGKYKGILIQDLGENGEQFVKVLDEISEAVREQRNPSKIKKAVEVLKGLVIGVSGSLIASGVLALLQNIKL